MEKKTLKHRDTAVAELAAELRDGLERVPEQVRVLLELARNGLSPGGIHGVTDAEYRVLYSIAQELCEAGDFAGALPLTLQLVVNKGDDARFAFLAGTCLQRLGIHDQAVSMFALALTLDVSHVAALYRLGECLKAEGRRDDAIQAFEAAIGMARAGDEYREAQGLAIAKLAVLRKRGR